MLELEFAVKMEQLKHMTQLQETKYISINKTLPLEMAHELQDIQELKTSVMEVMQSKEKELLQIQLDRQEVTAASKEVNSWLAKSELLLQEQIVNISDCRQRHQVIYDMVKYGLFIFRSIVWDQILYVVHPSVFQ